MAINEGEWSQALTSPSTSDVVLLTDAKASIAGANESTPLVLRKIRLAP